MNITGIRPYEAIGQYSNRIENRTYAEKSNQIVRPQGEYLEEGLYKTDDYDSRIRQTETALDYAKKYDATATYEMKGADSDLSRLDVMNEIPRAHRDEVLKQYQVFVGGNSSTETSKQDNVQRQLENFNIW